jgi:Clp amino terminal domain, pathogenicity island component
MWRRRATNGSPVVLAGAGVVMFERFTDQARNVVVRAQEQARSLQHNYIGTEHILLGLLAEERGMAAQALASLGVSLEAAREQVIQVIGLGKDQVAADEHIPFTPRAKKVLELSLREALHFGSNYIGTEHVLLGVIREGHGVAVVIMANLAGDTDTVRRAVVALARRGRREGVEAAEGPARIPAAIRPMPGILDTLRDINARLANIEAHLGIRKLPDLGVTPEYRPGADPDVTVGPEESQPGSETSGAEGGAGAEASGETDKPGSGAEPGQE